MSWIVQNLWSNRERIKNKSRRDNGIAYNFALLYGGNVELDEDSVGYDDPFIESDEFNDLMMIEKAVDELKELSLLSEEDLQVLYSSGQGIYTEGNKQRKTQARHFYFVCERIAYYLGGYFTDDGYLHYLAKKYKLTSKQVQLARAYMSSKFKNKNLNRGYRIEDNHEETRFVPIQV